MKFISKSWLFLGVFLLATILSINLYAAPAACGGPFDFIVIDTQRVLSQSKVFVNVQNQLNKFGQDLQKEYSDREAVLKKEYDTLLNNKGNYAPKALDQQMSAIQTKVKSLQDQFALKKQNYDKLSLDTSKIIEDKVKEIVLNTAKKYKVNSVFHAYSFIGGIYPACKDKTEEIRKNLDAVLPSINLKKP